MQKLVGVGGAFDGQEALLTDFQTIGRSPESNIVINDPAVSRDHAWISKANGVCQVFARDASVVMLINGHQSQGAVLRHLDTITLGRTTLQFVDLTMVAQAHLPQQQYSQQYPAQAVSLPPGATIPVGYPHPSQQVGLPYSQPVQQGPGAHVGPGGNFNAVNVQVRSDYTPLWILLAIMFSCPLMCVGLVAIAFLPYIMMGVGAILAIWGYLEFSKYQAANWQVPTIVTVKMWGGVVLAVLGLVLLITTSMMPKEPNSSPSARNPASAPSFR